MIVRIKGSAEVAVCFEDECDSCGHIIDKEEQRTIWIDKEVQVHDLHEAENMHYTGQLLTGLEKIIEKNEEGYFEGWENGPEIRPLEMDEILRRRGEPELL
jgi:hypothetical protein